MSMSIASATSSVANQPIPNSASAIFASPAIQQLQANHSDRSVQELLNQLKGLVEQSRHFSQTFNPVSNLDHALTLGIVAETADSEAVKSFERINSLVERLQKLMVDPKANRKEIERLQLQLSSEIIAFQSKHFAFKLIFEIVAFQQLEIARHVESIANSLAQKDPERFALLVKEAKEQKQIVEQLLSNGLDADQIGVMIDSNVRIANRLAAEVALQLKATSSTSCFQPAVLKSTAVNQRLLSGAV